MPDRDPMPARQVDVFFYGLFMDADLLRAKGFQPQAIARASAPGFALRIGQRAALVADPSAQVHGVVMSLSLTELERLYAEPSVQAYQPQAVLAHLEAGGVIPVLCYNLSAAPSPADHNPEYVTKLRAVAEKVGLPAAYVTSLR